MLVINTIMKELEQYYVPVPNISETSLQEANVVISKLENNKHRVLALLLCSIDETSFFERQLSSSKADYSSSLDELLTMDDEVRNQKSKELRESVARYRLRNKLKEVEKAKQELISAKSINDILREFHKSLISKVESVSRQITVVNMMIEVDELRKTNDSGKNIRIPRD